MTAQIRPNRLSVSDRFPMLGFTIRTGESNPVRIEITLATEPDLFQNVEARTTSNFFSTSTKGTMKVAGPDAAYVVPTDVMSRFIGAERLYFALATGPADGGALNVDVMPGADSPYVSLSGLSGRSLRRVRMFPQRGTSAGSDYGSDVELRWAGDAERPGMRASSPSDSKAELHKPPMAHEPVDIRSPSANNELDYDDGFGELPAVPETGESADGMTGQAQTLAYAMSKGDARLGERRPVTAPKVTTLGFWASTGVQSLLAAHPTLTIPIASARATAEAMDVSIGIGPAISGGGFGQGVGAAVGLIFAPGNVVGAYGTVEINTGMIAEISGTLQITILKGGVDSFAGMAFEAGFIVGAEGFAGGASALFNDRGEWIGITIQGGLGIVPTVIEFFASVQQTVAIEFGYDVAHAVKGPTVRALTSDHILLGEKVPIIAPAAEELSMGLKVAVTTALAANPVLDPVVSYARAAAAAANVSIGIGPTVSGGLGAGAQLGAGIIFAPGNTMGVYGSAEAVVGAIASVSLSVQVTVLNGGISSFEGIALTAGFSAGEGVVGGGSVIFDSQGNFLGISFQIGVGVGLSPLEVYASVQRGVAAQLGKTATAVLSTALDNGFDPFAIELKYRMFIPSPMVASGTVGQSLVDAYGADDRAFSYDQGSSRGEITATVHLNEKMVVDRIEYLDRHWSESTEYDYSDTTPVAGKPDWWRGKKPGATPKGRDTVTLTDDNLKIYAGAPAERNMAMMILDNVNWSIVTINASGTDPVAPVGAPAADANISVAFRYNNGLIQAKILGTHDGFPAHEIYVNGEPIYTYDPVAAGKGPLSMYGTGDIAAGTDWVTVAQNYIVHTNVQSLTNTQALQIVESFTINWDEVELINQPTDVSCWAASAAMVIGWRDRISLSPAMVAELHGKTTATGLNPADVDQFAIDLGLVAEKELKSWSMQGFRELLDDNGPLWIVSAPNQLHAIVVTGLYTLDEQLYVRITDPWDRVIGVPGSPGPAKATHVTGSRYIMTWEDFQQEFERPVVAGAFFTQILHSGGTGGRLPNRGESTPAGYAQSMSEPAKAPALTAEPLEVAISPETTSVVPPLTTNVNTADANPAVSWAGLVRELDPQLSGVLSAVPELAAQHGWTIGLANEGHGAAGVGVGVTPEMRLFRYGPPLVGEVASVARPDSTEPLLVTVVEGGVEAFTGWSKARSFTATDGTTGELLLNDAELPVGATMRLQASDEINKRIEFVVDALRNAEAASSSVHKPSVDMPVASVDTTSQPASSAITPASDLAFGMTEGNLSNVVPPDASVPSPPAIMPHASMFPPPGVQIFRSQKTENGVVYGLFLMDGSVLPQVPPAVQSELLPGDRIVLDQWPYIDDSSGRSYGNVAIEWSYGSGAIANVRTTPNGGAALDGWRVSVATDVQPGPAAPLETRLKVIVSTTFSRGDEDSQSGATEVILNADGTHAISYTEAPALAEVV